MPQSKLSELIQDLEVELGKFDPKNTNELVTQLEQDLKALKAMDLNQQQENHPFLETAIKFEDSHPKLAKTLNEIAYLLNNIGI